MKKIICAIACLLSLQGFSQEMVVTESQTLSVLVEDTKSIEGACQGLTMKAIAKIKAFEEEMGKVENIEISGCYHSVSEDENEFIYVDYSFQYTVLRRNLIQDNHF